jgi:hypothetical protein
LKSGGEIAHTLSVEDGAGATSLGISEKGFNAQLSLYVEVEVFLQ